MTSRIKLFYLPPPIGKRRKPRPRSREEEKPHPDGALVATAEKVVTRSGRAAKLARCLLWDAD